MFLIIVYILQLFLFFPIFSFFHMGDSEEIAIIFVVVNFIVSLYLLCHYIKSCVFIKNLFIIASIIRIMILFLDVYHIIPILHSGGDSEGFHMVAFNNLLLANLNVKWITYTNYSDILSGIYMLCNSQRLVGQYLNVIFGTGMIYYIWLSCRELKISNKTIRLVLTVICFFPTAIIFSGILLREAWQEFFLTYSLFYFIKWFNSGEKKYMLVSIFAVLASAYMHSGNLCVVISYLAAYIFYDPCKDQIQRSIKSVLKLSLVGILFLLFFFSETTLTDRFDPIKQMEKAALLESFEARSNAGSLYLRWINFDSTWEVILFSPLKMFYFMFSPIPFDWRGLNDLIAFLMNSMFYLFLIYHIIKYYNRLNGKYRRFMNFIVLGLLITIFVFAYGTQTAGTAMRHRCKIISFVLIAFAITYDKKKDSCLYKSNYFIY